MGFELTKLLGGLLMPLPVVLILLTTGIVLLLVTRGKRMATLFLVAGTTLLLLITIPPFFERALMDLEHKYPVLHEPPDAEWIIVLMGGSRGASEWPATARLGESSIFRIAEGVRLAKIQTGARLAIGGSDHLENGTGHIMAEVANSWGIDREERVVLHGSPRNTAEEARKLSELVDENETVILVTSAFHMRRAVALFEGQGISVVPAPAGHLVDPAPENRHIGECLPRSTYLMYAERVLWERIGLMWARLRGEI